MSTEDWILEVRKEFPGLRSVKNWILCDSPGGTQAHQVGKVFLHTYLGKDLALKKLFMLLKFLKVTSFMRGVPINSKK